jgi:hypothetical protein
MAYVYPRAGWGAAAAMSVAACIQWSCGCVHLRSILVGVGIGKGYRDLLADAGDIWTRRGGVKALLSLSFLNTLA